MVEPLCFSVQEPFISWSYLSSVCACWLKHFILEITKMAWKANNYNVAKIHVEQTPVGRLTFYKGFLNFALYFIILYWRKNMFIVMDQLDHSSYPKTPNIVWPKQHQSIRKSKSFMHHCLFACLFIHLLIYLFWIYQCTEVLHDALSRESIKPVFSPILCIIGHLQVIVPGLLIVGHLV